MSLSNMLRLKRAALSSPSEAERCMPQISRIITESVHLFSHLAEIVDFWLCSGIRRHILSGSDDSGIRAETACLNALAIYLDDLDIDMDEKLPIIWPRMVQYLTYLLEEFTATDDEFPFRDQVPLIFKHIVGVFQVVCDPHFDTDGVEYARFMTPPLLATMTKAWIKTFSRIDGYTSGYFNLFKLLRIALSDPKRAAEYTPVLSSTPIEIVVSCLHGVTQVLRHGEHDVDGARCAVALLRSTSIPQTSFGRILYRHGAIPVVTRLLGKLVQRPDLRWDRNITASCLAFIARGMFLYERFLLDALAHPFFEPIVLCHQSSGTRFHRTIINILTTVTIHCTSPYIHRRVERALKRASIDLHELPQDIRNAWIQLHRTMKGLWYFMDHIRVRQFRVCSYTECRKSGCEKRCSTCKHDFYCSKVCQRSDWPRHRQECAQLARAELMGEVTPTQRTHNWRLNYYKHLLEYEIFRGTESKKIREVREAFWLAHPTLASREIALQFDLRKVDPFKNGVAFRGTAETLTSQQFSQLRPNTFCIKLYLPYPSVNKPSAWVLTLKDETINNVVTTEILD